MIKKDFTQLFGHLKKNQHTFFTKIRILFLNHWSYKKAIKWKDHYEEIDFKSIIKSKKKSDTVFIFGSGWSINNIKKDEWLKICNHNTISFNWFIYQSFIEIDFHLIRETFAYVKNISKLREVSQHYCDVLSDNKFYNNSILFVQSGKTASSGNIMLGEKMLPTRFKICRFDTKSKGIYEEPSSNLKDGLVHGPGTLIDSINLAILGGWKKIVLVGVDLYNPSYFWLNKGNKGHFSKSDVNSYEHSTVKNGIIEFIDKWNKKIKNKKKEIYIYNSESLLSEKLTVYSQ